MRPGSAPELLLRSDRCPQPLPSRRVNGSWKLDHAGAADLAITIALVSAQISPSRAAISRARRVDQTREPLASARGPRKRAQNASQDSARSGLPCLTMISWGKIGADASSTFPANFGLAIVAIDQITAVAASDHCRQNNELAHLVS